MTEWDTTSFTERAVAQDQVKRKPKEVSGKARTNWLTGGKGARGGEGVMGRGGKTNGMRRRGQFLHTWR